MAETLGNRFKNAWNTFFNKDPTKEEYSYPYIDYVSSSYKPDRVQLSKGNERSIVTAVYNRIALDVSSVQIEHVRTDENGGYLSTIDSTLNNCLTLDSNIDQTGRSLIQDIVLSMFDEGCVAVVPTDTSFNPNNSSSYDILELRTGEILTWYPDKIKVRVYNEKSGKREDIFVYKKTAAIIENPLYTIMNEPNSTLKRLIRKLNLLDVVDEQSSSGKLDLIIQLPYSIKSEGRRVQAENRRKDIESQLVGSKYGIAYTDGTERITQLNRSVDNNLMKQIEYLTSMLYSQLGLTEEIMKGTADSKTMLNYYSRTIEPILSAITDEMKRKFLTKTARTQLQSISFHNDPFKLVPVDQLAEIADKFTRNAILSSNEVRGIIGFGPVNSKDANELRNKNLNSTESANSDEVNSSKGLYDSKENNDKAYQIVDSIEREE